MSRSSFPRPEHAALLRERIGQWLRLRAPFAEVAERGLNHYRCCYRFGFRLAPDQDWAEVAIHFQVAERLEQGGGGQDLDHILDSFWKSAFGAPEKTGGRKAADAQS